MIGPKHVAIIMDGNGRWGLKKKKTRNYGHSRGIETVKKIKQTDPTIKYIVLLDDDTILCDNFYIREDLLNESAVGGYCCCIGINKDNEKFNIFEHWVDFDFFGHQLVFHFVNDFKQKHYFFFKLLISKTIFRYYYNLNN